MMIKKISTLLIFVLFVSNFLYAQDKKDETKKERHTFTIINYVDATSVKNQAKTGTCWSFATDSFLESELLRMGKEEYDLSEMFVVRNSYPLKAEKYVRYHGNFNFGPGGQAHDVWNVYKEYGMVPEEVYAGMIADTSKHNHGEMDAVLKGILDAVLKKSGGKLTGLWPEVINKTLDIYLGNVPSEFTYKGETYTPKSFANMLGLNPDDYVEITSYTHHPFYEKFVLEVPDNWTMGEYYNVPLNDLIAIMNNALNNGYSVDWDGDVGKENFYRKKGYAVLPVDEEKDDNDNDEDMIENEGPEKEKNVTQEMRQDAYDNFSVTDDHLMHIVGTAEDQAGTKFYYTKNSWGTKDKKYDGYWYMSEPYVRMKTIAIMVHKDAVPQKIREKLGF
jgi:bleomycin hydrolase